MTTSTQEKINEFVARAHGDLPFVKQFLSQNPELVDSRSTQTNERAIDAAAHIGNAPIMQFLLEAGSELDICSAAVLGMGDRVREMLDRDPRLAGATGAHGIPVLFFAAKGNDEDIVRLLLERGAPVNGGENVSTPLHGAVASGSPEIVSLLVGAGADPGAPDFEGRSAIERASGAGSEGLLSALRP